MSDGERRDENSSLQALAESRSKLYESIGRIKAELASIDFSAEAGGLPPDKVEAPDRAVVREDIESALKAERDALKKALKTAEEALEDSEDARTDLLEIKVRLSAELDTVRRDRDQALRKIDSLEKNARKIRSRVKKAALLQEELRTGLEKQVVEKQHSLEAMTERVRAKQNEVDRLKRELEWLKSDTVSLADGASTVVVKLQRLLAERDETIAALNMKAEKASVLEDKLVFVAGEKDLLHVRLWEAEHRLSELEIALKEAQRESSINEDLAKALGEAKAEQTALGGEIEHLQVKLDALVRERDKLQMLREAAKKRVESLEAENRMLRCELNKTAENLNEVKRLIKMMEETQL